MEMHRVAYECRKENEDAERLVNPSQIFTAIFPSACLRIHRGNLRMARVCEERSIPRHVISTQFRVYYPRPLGSRPCKSSCLLCILVPAISLLEHAEK